MKPDIRNLDLNLLKTLDALLDERSVTRAAQRLALTQPAVSGMLVRLRDSFGDPLFVRAQRGMLPTARALELAAPVKQLLSDIEQLLQPAHFDPCSAELTLRLAATDYALSAVVVPFLAALRERAPGIRVAVLPVQGMQLLEQFERGAIDLALVTPQNTPGELHARPLFDERYVCLLRAGHPALATGGLSLQDFCALEHALVSYQGGGFSGVTDEALAGLGLARRVSLSLTSFLVLPQILRQSDLLAVVPSRLAQQAEGLLSVEPPLAIPGFTKTLAWHERSHRDGAQRWLRELLVEVCREAD